MNVYCAIKVLVHRFKKRNTKRKKKQKRTMTELAHTLTTTEMRENIYDLADT
jgi:transposase